MKTQALCFLLFISAISSYSQASYKIVEQTLPFDQYATSFTTDFIGLNEGFVMFHWQKFIENHGGVTYLK